MATLIKCSNCGNNVSSEAEKCPKCGKNPKAPPDLMKKCTLCGVVFNFDKTFGKCSSCGHDVKKEFDDKNICPRCGSALYIKTSEVEKYKGSEAHCYVTVKYKACANTKCGFSGSFLEEIPQNTPSFKLVDQGIAAYKAGDYAKALELFRKAADMGNADGMNNMGVLYEKGQGVPQDKAKALEWYKKLEAVDSERGKKAIANLQG